MKKIFLSLATLAIFSCSSDNNSDNAQSSTDKIIGKWFWGKEVYILEDNSEYEFPANSCTLMTSTEFKADGTVKQIDYYENGSGGCDLETEILEYGYQTKLSENTYKIVSKYPNEAEETQIETIEFTNENQFRYVSHNSGIYNGQNIATEYEYRNK